MKPLNGFIKIERIENKTSAGGILIPETANDPVWKAKVIDVGSGTFHRPNCGPLYDMRVENGDVVYFRPQSAMQLGQNSKDWLIHHDHLLGVDYKKHDL